MPNKALHRTAICARVLPWDFSFIRQWLAVGELVRRRATRLGFLRALCDSVVIFTTEAQRILWFRWRTVDGLLGFLFVWFV